MKKVLWMFIAFICGFNSIAQTTFPDNGPRNILPSLVALTNARIYTDYKTIIENGTLLINNGTVLEVGKDVKIPANARVIDLKGKYIYPSLIDIYTNYGIAADKKERNLPSPQYQSATSGAYGWNQAIHPETNAYQRFVADEKLAAEWRNAGFGVLLTSNPDGIARGTSALVLTGNGNENELVIKGQAAAQYSFLKGSSTQNYPTSKMGAVALLRQTYYDARWYAGKQEEFNISLEAWNKLQELPQIFEAENRFASLRADRLGDEFGMQYIIKGHGDEYMRLQEIKKTNAAFIVPLTFPLVYNVENMFDALQVSTADMKHWELAPYNLFMMQEQGITFSITSTGVTKENFIKNLRKAIKCGLTHENALRALTYNPAKTLGMESRIGSLKKGMLANFIVTSDSLFKEENIIFQNWVKGIPYTIKPLDFTDIRGKYNIIIKDSVTQAVINIEGPLFNPDFRYSSLADSDKGNLHFTGEQLSFHISIPGNPKYPATFTGWVEKGDSIKLKGRGVYSDGTVFEWSAKRVAPFEAAPKKKNSGRDSLPDTTGIVTYPFTDYGSPVIPAGVDFVITNATVWTNENDSVLLHTDVKVVNGKIAAIGKNLGGKEINRIDGTGLHLTCGIIDEHSHIAISGGVNEGSQAVTSEVRIGDVLDPDNINLYRQLSGGVTTAQLLHGSANPIGGQSAIIKLRWGVGPEELKFSGADGFIKFALGENVKQSNWGDAARVRFPQTRMGVEQVYYDAFYRAWEYKAALEKKLPVRRDLELDALVEILDRKRFITCHSYVQSEINMLIHVADSMKFKVNTFTHILEGYKVADKLKKHGAAASTFADWWAYKYEVIDAIPYNAAVLTRVGVLTAINSDDAEMGRRLNQEAAKTIKYGGMTEIEAWKMVTLNPAKMLHIDKQVGSIKVGKDADLVLWTANPLSIYAKVQKTFVDGICYFDADLDVQKRVELQKERARLIRKMIKAKENGEKTQSSTSKEEHTYHCEP
jgi:imidazolonepropionase-like amidohydrolase